MTRDFVGYGAEPPHAELPRPSIVVLGDSLTSGHGIGASHAFPAVLQQRLDARHRTLLHRGGYV